MTSGVGVLDLAQLMRGHAEGVANDDIPDPPYHVRIQSFIYSVVELDPVGVRAILPAPLEAADDYTGFMGIIDAPHGFGICPYSALFVSIRVKGFDSSDGSPGAFMGTGYYSGRAGRVMHNRYNRLLIDGSATQRRDGDLLVAEAGPGEQTAMRITVRPRPTQGPVMSGVHNYLGINPGGGVNVYPVSFSGRMPEAEVVSFEVFDDAPEPLRLLKPRSIPIAWAITNMSVTYGAPRLITDDRGLINSDATQVLLLDVFSRLGKAAAIVGADGRLFRLNQEAEAIAGEAFSVAGGRLKVPRLDVEAGLNGVIAGAVAGKFLHDPVALPRPFAAAPLLVYAMPIDPVVTGQKSVLLLFSDPTRRLQADTASALQLLGLTPAEARVAALVGAGQAPKDAAEQLSITESTARSALKLVYDKLGIGRQAELAQIVARLEAV